MINISTSLEEKEIQENIKKEIEYITSYISYQKNLKGYISNNFDTISLNLDTQTKNAQTDEITDIFQKVFEVRLSLDCNIINLQKLLQLLKRLEKEKNEILFKLIKNYNKTYKDYFSDINTKTQSAKHLADNLYSFIKSKSKKSKKLELSTVPEFDLEPIEDNFVLKISEKTGNVYLPYLVDDLKKILQEQPDKYSSLKDLINKKYIIPIKYYKNSSFARFREAYKLVRERGNRSISEALNLAFELLFNYNLNPAIISACKNIDELDIYLDCLEDNEIDDFYCFDIIYEVPPLLKNRNNTLNILKT